MYLKQINKIQIWDMNQLSISSEILKHQNSLNIICGLSTKNEQKIGDSRESVLNWNTIN